MKNHSDSVAMAERQVAEARADALAEYRAARANLRRLTGSPVFVFGMLLGAVALGFLALRRCEPQRRDGSAGAWSRAVKAVQALRRRC